MLDLLCEIVKNLEIPNVEDVLSANLQYDTCTSTECFQSHEYLSDVQSSWSDYLVYPALIGMLTMLAMVPAVKAHS